MSLKNYIIEILILIGTLSLILYSSEPVFYPDSSRYLDRSLFIDPPIYPTIIYIMNSLFGNLNSVIFLQTLLISIAIIHFIKTLSIYLNIDFFTKILVAIFLYVPIIKFYNHLLTEPISYSFSLFFVSYVIRLIYDFNNKNLIWNSIIVTLLLLTREQFKFLYVIILFMYCGIFIINNTKRKLIFLTISFVSIFLTHALVVNLNKNINQKNFQQTLLNKNYGVYFFTYIDAIYISNEKDIELFENKKIKKTLSKIFQEMNERKALIKYYNHRGHYALSLKEIRDYSDKLLYELAFEEKTTIIELKKEISLKLIASNFGKYIKHIYKKFYDSTWLFIFIPFFMFIPGIICFFKYRSNISLIVTFLSIFTIANHSVVYFFGRVQPRYLIYTDLILIVFILVIFKIFLEKKEN